MKKLFEGWTPFEIVLFLSGQIVTFVIGIINRSNPFALIAGAFNICNAILSAKGRVANYYFGIIGNLIYSIISFQNRYYSEVITNFLIVMPISFYGLYNWIKRRREGKEEEVKIATLSTKEILIPILSQIVLAVPYYYMLKYFNTDMLVISTFSMIATILAFYFMAKASEIFYVFFILSAVPKIAFWIVPLFHGDTRNIPLLISNIVYLVNDIYGLYNWLKMKKEQKETNA